MITRARTMSGSICAIACTAVLASALIAAAGSAASAASGAHRASRADSVQQAAYARADIHAATSVPPNLNPPAGQVLIADFAAQGVQVYQCPAGAWVFLEPAANLLGWAAGTSDIQTAIHFRGPSWESTNDGSLVQATAIASSPVPGSIPQLLLQATVNRGDGVFGKVTYVQRLNTSGGAAPAGACTTGQTIGVQYRAEYRFYEPAGS